MSDDLWRRGALTLSSLGFTCVFQAGKIQSLQLFISRSGGHVIPPYNIHTLSTREVMRIKKIINYGILSWCTAKFSELTIEKIAVRRYNLINSGQCGRCVALLTVLSLVEGKCRHRPSVHLREIYLVKASLLVCTCIQVALKIIV